MWSAIKPHLTKDKLLQGNVFPILCIALLSRAITLFAFQAVALVETGSFPSPLEIIETQAPRWDGNWYLSIARNGYAFNESVIHSGETRFAFYPVYPLTCRLLSDLFHTDLLATGIAVSHICFFLYLLFLAKICDRIGLSPKAKFLAVLLAAFTTNNFIFSAFYTESLFLALTTGSYLAYINANSKTAGILAALSAACRSTGVFLFLFYGLDLIGKLIDQFGWRIKPALKHLWEHPSRLYPFFLAPLGLFLFWWYCYAATGDAFAQKSSLKLGWNWDFRFPVTNLFDQLSNSSAKGRLPILVGLAFFAASFTLIKIKQRTLFLYCLLNFAIFFSTTNPASLARYACALFPIYIGLGHYLENKTIRFSAVLIAGCSYNLLMILAWYKGNWLSV